MTLQYTPYVGVLLINGLISAFIAFLVFRHRNTPGRAALTFIMVAAVEASLTSALENAAVGVPSKVFWAKLEYLGNQSGPVLFLIFALEYTHQDGWLNYRNTLLIWSLPLATMLLAATNDWHRLIWTGFTLNPNDSSFLVYSHGFWYWVCTAYGYLMILVGCTTLLRATIRSPQLFRRQIIILLLAAVVPGVGNLLYITQTIPVAGLDPAPISFSLAGLILTVGILTFGLLDIVPVARDVLIENMNDGVVVLDQQNRVVDINQSGQKLINRTNKEVIGRPVELALAFWSKLLEDHRKAFELQTEICASRDPASYFDLHITPLRDQNKQLLGRLVVFRDITKRRQIEEEFRRNVEELRIVNRISLAITAGLDMDHVLRTLYEQCSQVAPIDIFYVALYDEASSLINIPLYIEDGKYQTGPSRDINEQPGILGSIIRSRRTMYLHDTVNSVTRPLRPEAADGQSPIMSYVGIPLTLRERVIGALCIQNHIPNAYTDDQVHLLERIAIHAAIAIENARLYAEEQRLAIVDELTGIYNYRGAVELGAREVDRARRFKRPLSAIFFDIDNFRKFNNTYSHATGNIILQTVAQRCRNTLRSVDVFARYGGDEFVALLPETDLVDAEDVARRLYQEIASMKVTTSYGELGVTISIGVTVLSDDIPDLYTLIDRANIGERDAKRDGRGVVVA